MLPFCGLSNEVVPNPAFNRRGFAARERGRNFGQKPFVSQGWIGDAALLTLSLDILIGCFPCCWEKGRPEGYPLC